VLLTCFAVLATVLAAVGIYGVTTYGVTQRVREIGIRIALGAEGAKVRREVLIAGVRVALIGVLLGLAGATLVARLLQSLLFEVAALEPLVYVGAGVTMVGVAALACYLPARRASTVDPLTALRDT
jgi:putative ABC transport system permease protein